MSTPAKELNEFSARLATFKTPHHLGKRRASAQSKKKNAGTVEWPHEYPSAEGLARAGFYYKPASDSEDNVQCFTCNVKLDGWEPADDPISEHLAHSKGCAWATAISVIRDEDSQQEPEQRDPLSEEMASARHATFHSGDGWPHEGKKGWKCKVSKMVEAGWAWDPNDESEDRDGVTCFYCNLSLDGWEPKDDPFVEHKRREPGCQFFTLLEHYHGTEVADGKAKKGKARGKAAARSSTASKASRMSAQSTMSEVPSVGVSFADLAVDGSLAGADDSIVTTATTASQATTTGAAKGRKKAAAKPKAAAKGTKGRKKAQAEDDAMEVNYPELNPQQEQPVQEEEEIVAAPPKATRKPTKKAAAKQLDSSVVEISHMDMAPPKKATRGRKPKAQPQPEPEPEPMEIPQTPDAEAIAEKRLSEISAQLQDELDHTMDNFPQDESTPIAVASQSKRGVKRTSDGARKQQSSSSSAFEIDVPALPKASEPEPAPKKARGRPKGSKNSRSSHASTTMMEPDAPDELEAHQNEPEPVTKKARGRPKGSKSASARSSLASQAYLTASEPELEPQAKEELPQIEPEPATKKARGRPKGSKSASARSSLAVAVASEPEPQPQRPQEPEWPILVHQDDPEDLARDELEIESELKHMASEQSFHDAMEVEQDQADEFEASPSEGRLSKDSAEIKYLEEEIQKETENAAERQDQANEFEASPSESHLSKDGAENKQLEEQIQIETENAAESADSGDEVEASPLKARLSKDGSEIKLLEDQIPMETENADESAPRLSLGLGADKGFTISPTGSPSGSDKENQPQQPIFTSPTKTTRVPLAPGTPNQRSPIRMQNLSPSKLQLTQLTSSIPWRPVELDTALLASPQTPGRVKQQLAQAAGALSTAEKEMTIEQWLRYRAAQSEEALRSRCEHMVAAFEKEGMRALESLNGIQTVG